MNINFINIVNSQVYFIEQTFYHLIASEINKSNFTIYFLLILSGLLTSFNPCLLSIIPISLSYIYSNKLCNNQKIIFILGILSSTISTIIVFQLLHKQYAYLSHIFPTISYITTILISLNLLEIVKFNNNFISINKLHKKSLVKPFLYNYITGLIIGINSTSCTLPIILIILFWISYCQSWFIGSIYITIYLSSYVFPIYLIINYNLKLNRIKQWPYIWNNINLSSGCIMLVYSIFSLLNILFT
uniref:thiol:disulfide interchange protein n=1 Tax=Gracilaria urvillei TaxID=172974 RepID=UPI001D106CBA|nr:thiol:disulfide interchange protein [Hydropuntia urvillei]UAD88345.1 thiol:disulfide interchange protein [Hydropuntia urvillei]